LFKGFQLKEEDELPWARKLFGYSILYLTVFCAAIVVSTMLDNF
jgi:protoheme IX farnesyltransferase